MRPTRLGSPRRWARRMNCGGVESARAVRLARAVRARRSPGQGARGGPASDPALAGYRHRVRAGHGSVRARVQACGGRAHFRGVSAGSALFPGDDGHDLGARARPASRAERDRDPDLAASLFAAAPRRRARCARRKAGGAAETALRGGARRPQLRAALHPGRRRAAARRHARDRRQGFSVMATPSRRTPSELLAAVREGLGERAGFHLGRDGRQPLRVDPCARRRRAGDRRQRQYGRRGDGDRRAGACVRAVRRRFEQARRRDRRTGAARGGAPVRRRDRALLLRADRIRAARSPREIARRFAASRAAAA